MQEIGPVIALGAAESNQHVIGGVDVRGGDSAAMLASPTQTFAAQKSCFSSSTPPC